MTTTPWQQTIIKWYDVSHHTVQEVVQMSNDGHNIVCDNGRAYADVHITL